MAHHKFTLLLVDDETDVLDSLTRTFRKDYVVVTANSGRDAVALIQSRHFDLIISDQRMPEITGDQVLKFALETQPEAIRILLTGYADMESLVSSVNEASIYKYLTKPWEPEDLKLTVTRALEHQSEVLAHQKTNQVLQHTVLAYERFVPQQFLQLLNVDSIINIQLGDQTERTMTILFSDIRNFTMLSESMTPRENFNFINSYLSWVEPVIERHQGFIDKYIGDAIMALFPSTADDAVCSAIAMLSQLSIYNVDRKKSGYRPISIGIGLNTGMVMLGTIGGVKRMDGTVISDAVNLSSRLEDLTKVYSTPLLISEHTLSGLADAAQYHIRFIDRIRVKGRVTPVSVYEIFDNDEPSLLLGKSSTRDEFERALAYYHMQKPQQALRLLEQCVAVVPEDGVAKIYIDRCKDISDCVESDLGNDMPWSDDFSVGIDELDQQHIEVLSSMNKVMIALVNDDLNDALQCINVVQNQANRLFSIEVALMQKSAYPMQQGHEHEHQRFSENLTDFMSQVSSSEWDKVALRFRAQLILLDWFSSHTTKSDRHLAHHVLSLAI